MKILTNEKQKSYEISRIWYICKEKIEYKNDREVRKHCHDTKYYRGAAHGILRYLRCRYLMQFKVLRIQRNFFSFYNGSSYDYHFIIKKLA